MRYQTKPIELQAWQIKVNRDNPHSPPPPEMPGWVKALMIRSKVQLVVDTNGPNWIQVRDCTYRAEGKDGEWLVQYPNSLLILSEKEFYEKIDCIE